MPAYYAPGLYWATIIQQGLSEAKTGTAQIVLRIKILGPVHPENPDGFVAAEQSWERTVYMAVTEKTMQFLPEKLASLGYTGNSIARLDPSHPQHYSLVDQDHRFYCSHENSDNGLREKWDVARTAGSLELKPPAPAKMRALDELFARQVRANGGPAPAAPKPVSTPTASVITDDDVPF